MTRMGVEDVCRAFLARSAGVSGHRRLSSDGWRLFSYGRLIAWWDAKRIYVNVREPWGAQNRIQKHIDLVLFWSVKYGVETVVLPTTDSIREVGDASETKIGTTPSDTVQNHTIPRLGGLPPAEGGSPLCAEGRDEVERAERGGVVGAEGGTGDRRVRGGTEGTAPEHGIGGRTRSTRTDAGAGRPAFGEKRRCEPETPGDHETEEAEAGQRRNCPSPASKGRSMILNALLSGKEGS